MRKVTERDTKATILAALREAEKKIVQLEKGKLDPVAETNAKKKTETINKANEIMEIKIEDKISDLSKSVSSLLNQISEDIVDQTRNLQTIKDSISIKEAELKELYGIEKQAHTLAGLVNAHQELKLEQEKELVEAKEKATAELTEIQDKIKSAREEYELLVKEQKEQLAQSQKRQDEEYQYDFERHKKQALDKLEDELLVKRKEFDASMETRNAELDTYKKSLDERDELLAKREKKMNELEAEVAAFPTKLEETKAEVEKKADAEMKRVLAIREAAMKKEVEADKRILEAERDYFKVQLQQANETVNTLQAKLDEAYKRIQEMGIKMVSSSNESKAFDKIAALVTENKSNK